MLGPDDLATWEDYLLLNQLEISSLRRTGSGSFVVCLSNKYSREVMYILFFNYWNPDTQPDFHWKALHGGTPLSTLELNKLRARVQKVLNSLILFLSQGGSH